MIDFKGMLEGMVDRNCVEWKEKSHKCCCYPPQKLWEVSVEHWRENFELPVLEQSWLQALIGYTSHMDISECDSFDISGKGFQLVSSELGIISWAREATVTWILLYKLRLVCLRNSDSMQTPPLLIKNLYYLLVTFFTSLIIINNHLSLCPKRLRRTKRTEYP